MDDPFAIVRDKLPGALSVYVSNWCLDCRRLKKFLAQHDVPHQIVNISDLPEAAQRLEAGTGKLGVPCVLVRGARWVAGYHRGARGNFDAARFVRELAEVL